MRALVGSAFALTLLLSATAVFFALKSQSLHGEPFAVIAIDPPQPGFATAPKLPESDSVKASVTTTQQDPEQPKSVLTAVKNTASIPPVLDEPVVAPSTAANLTSPKSPEAPKLATEENDAVSEEASTRDAAALSLTRTTETARPVSTSPEPTDDPFFSSSEPGIGLGVGNLGPLEPVLPDN